MLRWLEQARAGSGEGLERVRAACGERLLAIASEELPGDQSGIRALVNEALHKLPALLSSFDGASEQELRAWLRQILFDQLETLPGPGSSVNGSAPAIDEATRGHGSGNTPPQTPDVNGSDSPPHQVNNLDVSTAPQGGTPGSEPRTVPEAEGTPPRPDADLFLPGAPQIEGFEDITPIATSMGVVCRARQLEPPRWVALKFLPAEFAADPDRIRRFRKEVELSSKLTEQGIVHVYAVLNYGGQPVLVLPFIDGCDLNKILTQRRKLRGGETVPDPHPLALKGEREYLAEILPFFDNVLDVLVNLHGAGVLHRDLKPSNILVDRKGLGWLTDFGLAKSVHPDPTDTSRKAMGTFGFMSPEQWAGEHDVDERADVFSMGVTIYQALTLEFPYGRGPINEATKPVRIGDRVRRSWPRNLDLLVEKALQPDRDRRYGSAAELRDDWHRVRKDLLPRNVEVSRRRRIEHYVRRYAIPTIATASVLLVAVLLAVLLKPASKMTRAVQITTEPAGAVVGLVPLNPDDGIPNTEQGIMAPDRSPVVVRDVPPGDYLVVVEIPGHGFQEVFRRVPKQGEKVYRPIKAIKVNPRTPATNARRDSKSEEVQSTIGSQEYPHLQFEERDGTVLLPVIAVPKSDVTNDMALISGGKFTMGTTARGLSSVPPHARSVASYYIDLTEVTVAAYRKVRGQIPADLRNLAPAARDAVSFVTYDDAVRCAEQMGKRLPDEAEYEYAATNRGRYRFPWGEDTDKMKRWSYGQVGGPEYDRALANPAICGLYSNVAEWTCSPQSPYPGREEPEFWPTLATERIVRGGTLSVIQGNGRAPDSEPDRFWDARYRLGINRGEAWPGLGFRCVRSAEPRFPDRASKHSSSSSTK
jgi:serine/threonine protein kinase